MVQTNPKPKEQAVIPIIPAEYDEMENEIKKFRAGVSDAAKFRQFRLRRGTYGQRQPENQMMRVKLPYGRVTANQLEALGVIATEFAPYKRGHFTTRENIQYHFLNLDKVPEILRILGDAGLSTREACGNTVRNVTGCPMSGICGKEPFDVTPYASAFVRYFVRQDFDQDMPRKFKTAFSGCLEDCAITGMHDLGFIPAVKVENGVQRKGFKMVAGGGLSIMARIAPTVREFVPVEEYLKVSEAVIRIFNQSDELRKNKMKARIKVLIDRIGIEKFRLMVDEELKKDWAKKDFSPEPWMFQDDHDHMIKPKPAAGTYSRANGSVAYVKWYASNVQAQRQEGYSAVYVTLPLGDVLAEQFNGLAKIARDYGNGIAKITPHQDMVYTHVRNEYLYDVWKALSEVGLADDGANEITDITSCPGTESCSLAIASSRGLAAALRDTLVTMQIEDPLIREMRIKISGCPDSCGQHYIGDLGFQGASYKSESGHQVPAFEVYVGGYFKDGLRYGHRLTTKLAAKRAPEGVKAILNFYQTNRKDGERFRDFVDRVTPQAFEDLVGKFKAIGALGPATIDLHMDWGKTVLYKVERGEGECAV